MRKIRKALSVLLALAMTLSLVTAAFAAAEDGATAATVTITAPEAGVKAGEAATFTVTLVNNPGVSVIGFKLSFVDAEGADVSDKFAMSGNWLTAGPILKDGDGESIDSLQRNTTNKTIVWTDGQNMDTDGVLATLRVTPAADVAGTALLTKPLVLKLADLDANDTINMDDVGLVRSDFAQTKFLEW